MQPPHTTIEGSRVINVMKLQQYINELTVHSTQCGGSVVLTGEARDGLALFCPVTAPLDHSGDGTEGKGPPRVSSMGV